MKKSVGAYTSVAAPLIGVAAVCAALGGAAWVIGVVAAGAAIWWSVYFFRLRYSVVQGVVYVHSGLIFRRLREIPTANIQWVTRLELPRCRRAVASVLHTAGGWIVIFADFSTMR